MLKRILTTLLLIAVLTGCNYPITRILAGNAKENTLQSGPLEQIPELLPSSTPEPATPTQSAPEPTSPPTQEPTESPAATVPVAPTVTSTPAAVEIGPEVYPEGVNPLTGLPVSNSQTLGYSPALVSITNFPISARPQAGLSFSPFVFEMYIGEGMTRFLALFYGDYPQKSENSTIQLDDDRIGPVRSGRLPFESLRKLYNGFLVMASASPTVKSSLNSYTNVWGTDQGDINSAMIPATRLEEIASQNPDRIQQRMLSGLLFDPNTPLDGKTANKIWIPFSFLNQVIWRYDAQSGAYLRYQDNADGTTFTQATDRLNNEPLTYENVVVLFADHAAARETLIDITFMYIDRMPALLFRDGKMYEIYWTTANADYEKTTGRVRPIRFIDAQGNPFPLKPGQTWVEIVQPFTRYREVVDSDVYFDQMNKQSPGSGNWAIYFFPTTPERK